MLENSPALLESRKRWFVQLYEHLGYLIEKSSGHKPEFHLTGIPREEDGAAVRLVCLPADPGAGKQFVPDKMLQPGKEDLLLLVQPEPYRLYPASSPLVKVYRFYHFPPGNETPGILSADNPVTGYWEKLHDMLHDLEDHCSSGNKEDRNGLAVYLGLTDPHLEQFRDVLRREFLRQGITVFPDDAGGYPGSFNPGALNDLMHRSGLVIEILSEPFGNKQEGETLFELQHRMASTMNLDAPGAGRDTVPRLIWVPFELADRSRRIKHLLTAMQRGGEGMTGAELIDGPVEVLKSALHTATGRHRRMKEPAGKNDLSEQVYLINDRDDRDRAEKILLMIRESGIECTAPWLEHPPGGLMHIHRQALVQSRAVVIFYGGNNLSWLNIKLREIMKAPGYGRTVPFEVCLLINESEERIIIPSNLDIQVIDGPGETDAAMLVSSLR